MLDIEPSSQLYRPKNGLLSSLNGAAPSETREPLRIDVQNQIHDLLGQQNYPCLAALRSYHQDDYQVGLYGKFGTADSWETLRNDLMFFVQEQKKSNSIYSSFWAVFEDQEFDEDKFEKALWYELSSLTSIEDQQVDWPDQATTNPTDKNFRFCLGGSEFFVVGLHANSARISRQFSRPTLIFNLSEQFEQLDRIGQYDSMVAVNRKRDLQFQGDLNPMVALHADDWETIQFSGKTNASDWKCPFQWMARSEKA